MYFGYGWPRILGSKAVSEGGECIYNWLDHSYLVVVTKKAVELWTGGQHRIRIGYTQLLTDGTSREQVAACWSPSKAALAILVGSQMQAMAIPSRWVAVPACTATTTLHPARPAAMLACPACIHAE